MSNPFNITKAVDYTDEELNKFWVDFPGDSFSNSIKPTSNVPMIVIGSKGSGKTHIMKHFSFTMQKIRYGENVLKGIEDEGYLGIYLRCSGLNAYKFRGKEESEKVWEALFSYYLELWLSQLLLININNLFSRIDLKIETKIIQKIFTLFDADIKVSSEIKSINDLSEYFNSLQKQIDLSINNSAFSDEKISKKIKILVSPGNLIFGIPEILSEVIPEFKKTKFLYLLDEFENFTLDQQKYFNTLIRERKNPVSFKIGARRYGIRTKETLNAGEEIKLGSEYEELDIDSTLRKDQKKYKEFIEKICIKRLESNNISINKKFSDYFQEFNIEDFKSDVINKKSRHLKKLNQKILRHKKVLDNKKIIELLSFEQDPLLERINILLFYREWKANNDLLIEAKKIKKSCIDYYKNKSKNSHSKVFDKYKSDLTDALARENNIRLGSYSGFDNLLRISNGIPRHFLIIMKHLYRWNQFDEVEIFNSTNNKISIKSQLNAIDDTANWFVENAKIPGKDGFIIKDCIDRLCDYLRELRFSDIPPECSISTFSIDSRVIPDNINEILNYLEHYSYIIKVNKRRDKNSNSRNITYQINGLLAKEWELSLSRRGIVNINSSSFSTIIAPLNDKAYEDLKKEILKKYNTPFNSKKDNNNPTLFEDEV